MNGKQQKLESTRRQWIEIANKTGSIPPDLRDWPRFNQAMAMIRKIDKMIIKSA